jgi:hypothetical protein
VAHVGCVTVPAVGADGVAGCALTTIFDDTADVHPAALVCVKVYVPALAVTNPVPDALTHLCESIRMDAYSL